MTDKEAEQLAESIFYDYQDILVKQLKSYLTHHYRYMTFNLSDVAPKIKGENKKDWIKRCFRDKPLKVLSLLINEIHNEIVHEKIAITPDNTWLSYCDRTVIVRHKIKIDKIKYLTDAKIESYILNDGNYQSSWDFNLDCKIESINNFTSEVTVICKIEKIIILIFQIYFTVVACILN